MTRKIVTKHEPSMGWFAYEDDPEGLVGCGRTEAEAVEDLERQEDELEPDR